MIIRSMRALALTVGIATMLSASAVLAADGANIDSTAPINESAGDGQPDSYSSHGATGGNGGTVIANVSGDYDEVTAISSGGYGGYSYRGDGGDGGTGGAVTLNVSGTAETVTAASTGGDAGSGPRFTGGDGGNGGSVDVTLFGAIEGDLTATSSGGARGSGRRVGANDGSGGDVTVDIQGDVDGNVTAISTGLSSGAGGDVTVTISGTVGGTVEVESAGASVGTVKVILDGGVVTGEIKSTGGTSELTFDFDVTDKAEFDTAASVLTAQAATGTVTINGASYRWSNFNTLVNALRFAPPAATVVVTVTNTTTTVGEAAPTRPAATSKPKDEAKQAMVMGDIPLVIGKPEVAKCSGDRSIRTVRQDNGSIVVIQRSGGADVMVGQIKNGAFRANSNAASGWTVQASGTSLEISDSGSSSSSCSFS